MPDDKTEEEQLDVFVGDMVGWKESEFTIHPSDYKIRKYVGVVVEINVPRSMVGDILQRLYYSYGYDAHGEPFSIEEVNEVTWVKVLTIAENGRKIFRYLSLEDEYEIISRAQPSYKKEKK